ncbi:MAG: DUF1292 domain-containing protein [Candidatus Cloacimonetes bacterium]|nr:DUF1292 domain-containing protein [Candidatus Cloacimonadota bacterium]
MSNKKEEHEHGDEDHIHEYLTLEWDDGGAVECLVLANFEFEGKQYVALEPEDDEDDAYIYVFSEDEENGVQLDTMGKDEFDRVSAHFYKHYTE